MFLSPNSTMKITKTQFPDLSLQIRPPSVTDGLAKSCLLISDMNSTTDSGSSGSDLSNENNIFINGEPTLSLGLETKDLRRTIQVTRSFNSHNYNNNNLLHRQPQIYGRDFKRNSRMVTSGVKRSVRAPRMRWTTTLHAHFVHAVQLLGGHESKFYTQYLNSFLFIY